MTDQQTPALAQEPGQLWHIPAEERRPRSAATA